MVSLKCQEMAGQVSSHWQLQAPKITQKW